LPRAAGFTPAAFPVVEGEAQVDEREKGGQNLRSLYPASPLKAFF
jgi:hypothetical protein